MLSIQTNVNSMNAQENLRTTNLFQGRTIARLTSGFRINESGDDAAGLAVANKYRSDVAELMQGVRNANDGLSTLQIIDGGLNNISKMLDRLKTLATQSASTTFTGNRATLNSEFQSLLSEIDRQAANIGLSDVAGGNGNNIAIDVYVGGGGTLKSNSKVTVDLSATTDRVNRTGLGLSGQQINGGSAAALNLSRNLKTSTSGHLAGGATQIVKVRTADQMVTATLTGTAAGLTSTELIDQLNAEIASSGVSAAINQSTGLVEFYGSNPFSVSVADPSSGFTGLTSATTSTGASATQFYKVTGAAWAQTNDDLVDENQDLTITIDGGASFTATITNAATTVEAAAAQLNNQLNSKGVYAVVNAAGTSFDLYSSKVITVDSESMGAGGDGWTYNTTAVGAPVDLTAGDPAAAYVGAPTTNSGSAELAAQTAITAIANAVTNLGSVQGKIGTGQNRLTYAIQLAQSQITSFSAAESRIRDADVASEAANLTKAQVLQQASLAALAQANSAPQAVLSLLRG